MTFSHNTLAALEFDKVLDVLCRYCSIPATENKIKEIRPSGDFHKVDSLLKKLDFFVSCVSGDLCPKLIPCNEVTLSVQRAQKGGILDFAMLLNIAKVLKNSADMYDYFEKYDNNFSNSVISGLYVNNYLYSSISEKITSEDEMSDSASEELFRIRRSISSAHNRIRSSLDSFISRKSKFLQEQIVTLRGDRYVVPVKSEYKSEVPGIVHDLSASGSTFFVEPSFVVSENNILRELYAKEKDEIERVLAELSDSVAENGRNIINSFKALMEIDIFFAKANFSLEKDLYMPKLTFEKEIKLYSARHPLIDADKVVPVDIFFGGEVRGLLITGPNTGGKTVALKTLGLCAAMACSGLFIPADSRSSIFVFSDILLSIGDEQSIEQSLSTFSAHMKTIIEIVRNVTPESLVLVDEIGNGTDPTEGAALSIAVLEYIYSSGAMFAVTTHYSELKLYAIERDYIQNACCEFDEKTLLPTYRLLMGLPGKSNAFHIAKKLGLPAEIIEDAKGYMDNKNIDFESILSKTQQLYSDNLRKSKEIDKNLSYINSKKDEIEKESLKLSRSKEKIISEAKEKARDIVSNARFEVKEIISQLGEMKKKKDFSLNRVNELRQRLNEAESESVPEDSDSNSSANMKQLSKDEVKEGMEVWLNDIGEKAVVIKKPNSSGKLSVQTENLRMDTYLSNISMYKEKESKNKKNDRSYDDVSKRKLQVREVSFRAPQESLHIRGERFEEAMYKTEQFLDAAVYNNLKTVTIIHGKGAGILKNGVHDLLRKNKFVKSFRLGMYGEGDHGVTVVEFK